MLTIGPFCHELAIYPVACRNVFPADRSPYFFTPKNSGQTHSLHQSRDGASGHAEALTLQLPPDFTDAIDAVVFVIHSLYFRFQLVVTVVTLTTFLRMLAVFTAPVVRRRGDIQLMTYRSDPVTTAEGIQQRHYFFHRRSYSAFAK
ncbi:hypothetical protein D3C81_787600 [compost metagenome]